LDVEITVKVVGEPEFQTNYSMKFNHTYCMFGSIFEVHKIDSRVELILPLKLIPA
jgi:hypothetical protein